MEGRWYGGGMIWKGDDIEGRWYGGGWQRGELVCYGEDMMIWMGDDMERRLYGG